MLALALAIIASPTGSFKLAKGLAWVNIMAIGHGAIATRNIMHKLWMITIGLKQLKGTLVGREMSGSGYLGLVGGLVNELSTLTLGG